MPAKITRLTLNYRSCPPQSDGSRPNIASVYILQSPTANPGQIPPLVRVAYAYEYALNTLKYAGTVLAQAMES